MDEYCITELTRGTRMTFWIEPNPDTLNVNPLAHPGLVEWARVAVINAKGTPIFTIHFTGRRRNA
jgi:hypothetical protein